MMVDIVILLIASTLVGVLFSSKNKSAKNLYNNRRGIQNAMLAGTFVFPILMLPALTIVNLTFPPPMGVSPTSSWFILTIYTPFVMTGCSLPLLHLVAKSKQVETAQSALPGIWRTTFLVFLLWGPFNFIMLAFGFSFLSCLLISVVAIGPAFVTVALTEKLTRAAR